MRDLTPLFPRVTHRKVSAEFADASVQVLVVPDRSHHEKQLRASLLPPDRPPRKRLSAPILGMSPTSKPLQEVNAAVAIAGRKGRFKLG
jgi:hypothetical protein